MRFRQRLFMVLALMALAWIAYGFYVSANVYQRQTAENETTISASQQGAAQAGTAIGTGIGLTFFLCSGLPFFVLFSLLSWRNGVGLKREQMHKEQLAAIKGASQ